MQGICKVMGSRSENTKKENDIEKHMEKNIEIRHIRGSKGLRYMKKVFNREFDECA